MKYYINLLILSLAIISCDENKSISTNKNIGVSTENLKKHTVKLASDEYEGRGAGYKGEKEAAIYIAKQFESSSLEPINRTHKSFYDYFSPFEFHTRGSTKEWEILNTQNVVGIFKGSGLPEEYIIVGAHHDGQGKAGQADLGREIDGIVSDSLAAIKDTIWNSAIDNAVSISAIIEIIRVLKENNIQTKKSIIFSTFSAEESGLDGSIHLANNLPVPRSRIKAMINLEKLIGDPDSEFLYVSYESNPIFEQIQIKLDSLQAIKLTPFYPGIIADTDHFAFFMRKIPSITIGTGSQINVHTSLDHAQNLDFNQLKDRTNYILSYIIELANSESAFNFSGNLLGHLGVLGGPATKSEIKSKGSKEDVAFKVTSVIRDSRGYNSNIIPGDLIVAIDNEPLKFPKFYQGLMDIIGETKGNAVTLKILRDNTVIESTIVLR